MPDTVTNSDILLHLGKIEGQVGQLMNMMQSNQTAINQRLDDMRTAMSVRIESNEKRIDKLEQNERGTAIKAGVAGTVSGTISAAMISAAVAAMRWFGQP